MYDKTQFLFLESLFSHYIRFLNLRFRQFQKSITLDTDMILTSSFHQFEALDVA